ncbi:MAG TPA: hypothetical protein PLJ32_06500 [Kiritimatiellia bacterium]|nr:hypothetical protein [Kiritimatiellia bacterium]
MKRLARMGLLKLCAAAVASAGAQTLGTGTGGLILSDDNRTVLAPPPVHADGELIMAELPLRVMPPRVSFLFGTSGRHGPIDLTDGSRVGNPRAPYVLRLVEGGASFTLSPESATNQVSGPFSTADRTVFTLSGAKVTLVRVPPELRVAVRHAGETGQAPKIGVSPYTPEVTKALYALRTRYVGLANRVDVETADIAFQGVPRVHSRITGNTFTPVVKRSERDKQQTLKGAERSAVTFLDSLFRQAFSLRSQAITDGCVYHFRMPPGEYLLCVMQPVRDPDARGNMGSATAIWWTAFYFDGERSLEVELNGENAITWRDLFKL